MFDWFHDTFFKQVNLQENIKGTLIDSELPDVVDMYGAATGMIIEIGEMLQCDTRWKEKITGSKKTPVYNREQFLEELSDVFIYMLNTIIYAGITLDEFKKAVYEKQEKVKVRFKEVQNEN